MQSKIFIHPVINIIEVEHFWDEYADHWLMTIDGEQIGAKYKGNGTDISDVIFGYAERLLFEEKCAFWTLRILIKEAIERQDWDMALWLIEGRGYYRGINATGYTEHPVPYSKAFPRESFFSEGNYRNND